VITGFITVAGRDTPVLTRMVLNCCAADAQPVKVGLTGQVPSGLRPDTWFEVVGAKPSRSDRAQSQGASSVIMYLRPASRGRPPR
jgi:uncharacterized membrane protein YcgQ (UPF0703/DUF1980 family)